MVGRFKLFTAFLKIYIGNSDRRSKVNALMKLCGEQFQHLIQSSTHTHTLHLPRASWFCLAVSSKWLLFLSIIRRWISTSTRHYPRKMYCPRNNVSAVRTLSPEWIFLSFPEAILHDDLRKRTVPELHQVACNVCRDYLVLAVVLAQ